jgi:multiple sugar transport system permease protein
MAVIEKVAAPAPRVARKRRSALEIREAKWGLFFLSPWITGFLLFYLLPMVASLVFSVMRFQLATPEDAQFIGLSNWSRMLFEDPLVWTSMGITFKYAAIALPIGLLFALFLAILLNSEHVKGKNVFRTLFYMPTMVPGVAAVLIWSGVLNSQTGWLNRLLQFVGFNALGIDGIRWLDDPSLIYIAYAMIGLWGVGNAMIIMLAGLQGVPTELYDAAKVDGASWLRRLWHITLPMMSPVLFYNLVIGVILILQYFTVPYVLNGGSGYPAGTTRFFMIYFYKQAFAFANMGYGATLAWLMFFIALVLTLVLFGTAKYWVYYAAEDR